MNLANTFHWFFKFLETNMTFFYRHRDFYFKSACSVSSAGRTRLSISSAGTSAILFIESVGTNRKTRWVFLDSAEPEFDLVLWTVKNLLSSLQRDFHQIFNVSCSTRELKSFAVQNDFSQLFEGTIHFRKCLLIYSLLLLIVRSAFILDKNINSAI